MLLRLLLLLRMLVLSGYSGDFMSAFTDVLSRCLAQVKAVIDNRHGNRKLQRILDYSISV